MEICCRTLFFEVFCSIFRLEEAFRGTKVAGRVPVYFKDKLENYPTNPVEIGQFSSFRLIIHFSLPKIWITHPHKNYIFLTIKDMIGQSFHKVWLS